MIGLSRAFARGENYASCHIAYVYAMLLKQLGKIEVADRGRVVGSQSVACESEVTPSMIFYPSLYYGIVTAFSLVPLASKIDCSTRSAESCAYAMSDVYTGICRIGRQ